jgi:hypothetical protein
MNTLPTNRQEAAELFLQMLIAVACEGTFRTVARVLVEGADAEVLGPPLSTLHSWYADLSQGDQSMVLDLVREASRSSVFDTLVLLDGRTGGRYREGKVLEFGLYLEVYSQRTYNERDVVPEARIRLNPVREGVPDLHDLFNEALE